MPSNQLLKGIIEFIEAIGETSEAAALNPEFAPLFTDEERAEARRRLKKLRYDPETNRYY